MDRERLLDVRFADDVALTTGSIEDTAHQLSIVNEASLKVDPKT